MILIKAMIAKTIQKKGLVNTLAQRLVEDVSESFVASELVLGTISF